MGGFCPGGFCPRGDFVQGDFVRGGFVRGDFVLEPLQVKCSPQFLKECISDKLRFELNPSLAIVLWACSVQSPIPTQCMAKYAQN